MCLDAACTRLAGTAPCCIYDNILTLSLDFKFLHLCSEDILYKIPTLSLDFEFLTLTLILNPTRHALKQMPGFVKLVLSEPMRSKSWSRIGCETLHPHPPPLIPSAPHHSFPRPPILLQAKPYTLTPHHSFPRPFASLPPHV